jgi:hypothetical protein
MPVSSCNNQEMLRHLRDCAIDGISSLSDKVCERAIDLRLRDLIALSLVSRLLGQEWQHILDRTASPSSCDRCAIAVCSRHRSCPSQSSLAAPDHPPSLWYTVLCERFWQWQQWQHRQLTGRCRQVFLQSKFYGEAEWPETQRNGRNLGTRREKSDLPSSFTSLLESAAWACVCIHPPLTCVVETFKSEPLFTTLLQLPLYCVLLKHTSPLRPFQIALLSPQHYALLAFSIEQHGFTNLPRYFLTGISRI